MNSFYEAQTTSEGKRQGDRVAGTGRVAVTSESGFIGQHQSARSFLASYLSYRW